MKKIITLLLAFIISGSCLIGFSACKDSHEHDYKWVIAKNAKCEEDGLAEGICSTCGKKDYVNISATGHDTVWIIEKQPTCTAKGKMVGYCSVCSKKSEKDIETLNHTYVNDICSVCGFDNKAVYLPMEQKLGFTIADICEMGTNYGFDQTEMINIIKQYKFINPYVSNNGSFRLVAEYSSYSYSINLGSISQEFKVQNGCEDVIRNIDVNNNCLVVQYFDGTQVDWGCFKELNDTVNKDILSIAINNENELLIVIEDSKVIKVGKFSSSQIQADESVLYYKLSTDGQYYIACGVTDETVKEITVPPTHRGLPVKEIGAYCFSNMNELEKVVISEGVKEIKRSAFVACDKLKTVYLPKTIENISIYAIYDTPIEKIYFSGTQTEWQTVKIYDEAIMQAQIIFGWNLN